MQPPFLHFLFSVAVMQQRCGVRGVASEAARRSGGSDNAVHAVESPLSCGAVIAAAQVRGGGAQLRVIMPANANGFDIAAAFIIDPRVSICSQPHHVLVHTTYLLINAVRFCKR